MLAQTGKKKEEKYDPDTLPPGEVACGRVGSKRAPPCKCVQHRQKVIEEALEKCKYISDRDSRMACFKTTVPACEDVKVMDSESWVYNDQGERMAPQCKRTCSKARCECCHS